MTIRLLPILLFSIFTYGYSFCQYSNLLNKTYAERAPLLIKFYLDTLRDKKLDSIAVFAKIDAISSLAESHSDNDLLLETQLMRIHYFFYRDQFNKSRPNSTRSWVKTYSSTPSTERFAFYFLYS